MTWARAATEDEELGPEVDRGRSGGAAGRRGVGRGRARRRPTPDGTARRRYALRQPPEVEGAVVALDPHTGRVLAMSGGFSFARSVFNRATQALRQPGSALKPFVYLAGLESGLTPSSILLDAPIVIDQGPGQGKWKPANYSGRFYGAEHAAPRASRSRAT